MTTTSVTTDGKTEAATALRKVQQRVAAIGFFAIASHGVIGTIAGAYVVEGQGRHDAAVAFIAMSAIIALLTFGGVRIILQRSLWAPMWIALALVPTAVAIVWLR